MAHTNSTTNYGLPQFLTTDKPAWLTDVNTAYSDIDLALKNNADAATTAGNNAVQALSDASAASTAASTADSKASGAIASISDTFDATATYAVGAVVMYNNLLYKCTVAVTTPGTWTGSANWDRITVEDMLDNKADQSDTYTKAEVNTLIGAVESVTMTNGTYSVTVGDNKELKIINTPTMVQATGYFQAAANISANSVLFNVGHNIKAQCYYAGYINNVLIPLTLETSGNVKTNVAISSGSWMNMTVFGFKN